MDVILGVYSGYRSIKTYKGGIYYFARSLRKYNKDCKVYVLCEKQKLFKELEDLCAEYNLEIYSDFTFRYDLMLQRYEIYQEILAKLLGDNVDKVLFCDLDDVVFQGDPFSIQFEEPLYCAAEQNILSDVSSSSSGLNRHWMGQAAYVTDYQINTFEDQPVVCAGTILGNYNGIQDCLKFYAGTQSKRQTSREIPDQGLYNIYIYYHTDASFRKILPHKNSQILTLDNVIFDTLAVQNNQIVNANGELYKIIHQINRCNPEFMKSLAD